MFLKRAVPVGPCDADELRDLLFHTWCTRCSSRSCRRCLGNTGNQCPTNHNSLVNCQMVKMVILASMVMFLKYRVKKKCHFLGNFFGMYWFCLVHVKYRKSSELVGMLVRCTLTPLCILNMHAMEKSEKSRSVCAVWQIIGPTALLNWQSGMQLMLWSYLNASNLIDV